jgi:gluconokinase
VIVVLMGVAGAGKTTVGRALAQALGCPFLDADSLHPLANIEKMARGIPLTDADRAPWLAAVRASLESAFAQGHNLVIACSALKQQYRDFLSARVPVIWVYLKGTEELIRSRLEHRREHFMKARMLASQFADLEEPSSAIVVDVLSPPDLIVQEILAALQKRITEPHAA